MNAGATNLGMLAHGDESTLHQLIEVYAASVSRAFVLPIATTILCVLCGVIMDHSKKLPTRKSRSEMDSQREKETM